jgi:uncharacterized protein YkwD
MSVTTRLSRFALLVVSILSAVSFSLGSAVPVAAAVGGSPAALVPAATPWSAVAASMARTVLVLMNRDRAARGLRPLVADTRLNGLATSRAAWMAARDLLSHTSYGGSILTAERHAGVMATFAGECIGWTTATWGSTAARWMYDAWKHSPEHWALMMSSRFTRVGIGFAYRWSGRMTFGSIALARV